MKRAYSLLDIKSIDESKREFSGIATTPTPDREGDIVEPLGGAYELPIPLIWQHQSDKPVGEVFYARPTKTGIPIKGRVFEATQSRALIERLDEAWESLKLRLVRGLSIGFLPIERSQIGDTWSYRFIKWDWLELSLVTIPANADARIETVKSIDRRLRAASGQRKGAVLVDPNPRRAGCTTKGAVYLPRTMRNDK